MAAVSAPLPASSASSDSADPSARGSSITGNTSDSAAPPPVVRSRGASTSSDAPDLRGQLKRKRGPNSVTSNACTACKRAKAKCDGSKPTCLRCRDRRRGEDCHYEMHTKIHKEEMIREIRALREKNNWVERILCAIQNDEQGTAIIERLKEGESYEAISKSLNRPPFAGFSQLSPSSQTRLTKAIAEYAMDLATERDAGSLPPGATWTQVTSDADLVDNLMALYFAWIHPVHMLFSENHFMASYKNRSDLYCTSALVNAICAMACHLYDVPSGESSSLDLEKLRDKFSKEALETLSQDEQPKMTTIQSYALLFLVDLGMGQGSRASHYLRLAGEAMNMRLEKHYSTEAMEITRWGIYALNVAWASLTFQVPSVQPVTTAQPEVFEHVLMDTHDDLGRFYQHAGYDGAREHPSTAILVARETAKLMLNVHKTIDLLYDRLEEKLTACGIIERYKAYVDWEKQLPETLSLPKGIVVAEEAEHITPHVLTLHIQYHTAMIHLFQPFLHLPSYPDTARQTIMEIVVDHARKGYEAVHLYQELFSCRYQPSIQTFCLLHNCDILIRFSPSQPSATAVVELCLLYLKQSADSRGGFPVCRPLQEMFRRTAVECNVRLPDNTNELMGGPANQISSKDLLDASTRLSYKQPVERVVSKLNHGISDTDAFVRQFAEELQALTTGTPGEGEAITRKIRIDELLNDTGESMEM